jgi:hypothetical protein
MGIDGKSILFEGPFVEHFFFVHTASYSLFILIDPISHLNVDFRRTWSRAVYRL